MGQGKVEEKEGLVETMAESGEFEYECLLVGSEGYSLLSLLAAAAGAAVMWVIPTTVWF